MVTELLVSKDSDKKVAAEVLPNSVTEHEEIAYDTAEAKQIAVPQQEDSVSKDSNKKLAAEVLANSVPFHKEIANNTAEAMIDEAAETMPNSVTVWGEFINEVSTTNIDVCGNTAGNNVETTNVTKMMIELFWTDSRNVSRDMKPLVMMKW